MSNLLTSDIIGYLHRNDLNISEMRLSPKLFAEITQAMDSGKISEQTGKSLLLKSIVGDYRELRLPYELSKISEKAKLEPLVDRVFIENFNAVQDASKDKKVVNYLMGLVMRATGGRADPKVTQEIILKKISIRKPRR